MFHFFFLDGKPQKTVDCGFAFSMVEFGFPAPFSQYHLPKNWILNPRVSNSTRLAKQDHVQKTVKFKFQSSIIKPSHKPLHQIIKKIQKSKQKTVK
jgi:hypothetical protein